MKKIVTVETVMITHEEFLKLVEKRSGILLRLASYLSCHKEPEKILTRPLLGELMSQAIQMEEFIDAYGAGNNRRWHRFRLLVATVKLFSDVSYELLHIKYTLPAYQLLPIEQDFSKATEQTLGFTCNVLLRTATEMLAQASQLGLSIRSLDNMGERDYAEQLPGGRLARDLATRHIETVAETVTLLATAFLNLVEESGALSLAGKKQDKDSASEILKFVKEEDLRQLKLRFHNLQSLYDTHVLETEVEQLDRDLPVLRGHISVVFHLLKVATAFSHYYERHISRKSDDRAGSKDTLVSTEQLLCHLINYSISYSNNYIECARNLCYQMLKRYAEIGEIEVPVPCYRGFHVRPATLISKIVIHYGSNIEMKLGQDSYNAGYPLDIFRINEKINAEKRHWTANEIDKLGLVPKETGGRSFRSIIYDIVLILAEKSKLLIYEQPLQLPDDADFKERVLLQQQVTDEMARLQAIGKIDIKTDLKVKFIGDKRVLADIKLLAESGYGEDSFGNNIDLPKELSYLRR